MKSKRGLVWILLIAVFLIGIKGVVGADLIITSGTTSLGGDLTYDSVYVESGAILEVNGTGWLNITAVNNITIYGMIDGTGKAGGTVGNGGAKDTDCDNRGATGGTGKSQDNRNGGTGGQGGATQFTTGGGSGGTAATVIGTYNGRYESGMNYTGGAGGGGGGGGASVPSSPCSGLISLGTDGTAGGYGGASVRLYAPNVTINGTIRVSGQAGGNGGNGGSGQYYQGYGGGGGAGASAGQIIIDGNYINISNANLTANGGKGGTGGSGDSTGSTGQNGAGGRVKIFYYISLENESLVTSVTGGNIGTVYFGFTNPAPGISQIAPVNGYYSDNENVTFNCTATDDTNVKYMRLFLNGLESWNVTGLNPTMEMNKTLNLSWGATYLWSCEAEDENEIKNITSNRTLYIDAILNLTFSQATNITISSTQTGYSYKSNSSVFLRQSTIGSGTVFVEFGNNQIFSYYNDNRTNIVENLFVDNPDLSQKIKVIGNGQELVGAWIKIERGGGNESNGYSYATFTDANGMATILVDDGVIYRITVEKEGYETYIQLHYIPIENTDTIVINLVSETNTIGGYYFLSSCGESIGEDANCSFYVRSPYNENLTFNWTWTGVNYTIDYYGDRANLTLLANSTTTPIYVCIYGQEDSRCWEVEWNGFVDRTIQLVFDADEIKNASYGILTLFYTIVFVLGIMLMVIVNKIPHMKGKGIWAFTIWIGVVAMRFPLLWFIVATIVIYGIFKVYWGQDD